MGYMSAAGKIINKQPKKNSKAQRWKKQKESKLTHNVIKCKKCHASNTTLYNIGGEYLCKNCKEGGK